MPRALPLVLSTSDLPHPELLAARLDGELFGVGWGFCPVDEILSPLHRAFLVTRGMPERLIPEQLSAAWIWGALDAPPGQPQFCVRLDARVGHPTSGAMQVREVVLEDSELAVLGRLSVTSPLRTAVDLARFSSRWTNHERQILGRLMTVGSFDRSDVEAYLDTRHKLPAKRLARSRIQNVRPSQPDLSLAGVDAVHVVDGVNASHSIQHTIEMRGVTHLEDEAAERETLV